jgi:parvulin-like peptidyl-prolyl isomerase
MRPTTGGTDTHLALLDLQAVGVSGKDAEARCGASGIVVNKNAIPFDPAPASIASGIRVGTPSVTTRGMQQGDMKSIALFIDRALALVKTGDQIKASHILVKTEKEAKDILAQIKGGGNFEELAKKHSVDSSASKGGDLGWFGKGSMLPEFEKVAFGLKENETSGIVKTKFGFHIIKLTGKRVAGLRDFSEVKEQIKAALLPTKQQEIFQKLKDDLKKSSKYTIKEDVLKKMDAGNAVEDKGKQPEASKPAPPAPGKK